MNLKPHRTGVVNSGYMWTRVRLSFVGGNSVAVAPFVILPQEVERVDQVGCRFIWRLAAKACKEERCACWPTPRRKCKRLELQVSVVRTIGETGSTKTCPAHQSRSSASHPPGDALSGSESAGTFPRCRLFSWLRWRLLHRAKSVRLTVLVSNQRKPYRDDIARPGSALCKQGSLHWLFGQAVSVRME
jgi:hypothetical protein